MSLLTCSLPLCLYYSGPVMCLSHSPVGCGSFLLAKWMIRAVPSYVPQTLASEPLPSNWVPGSHICSPSPVTPLDTVQHPVACSVTNSFVSQLCVAGDTHSTEYKYQLKRTHTWRKRRQWGLVNALIFQSLLLMMVLKRFNLPSSPPPTRGSGKEGLIGPRRM